MFFQQFTYTNVPLTATEVIASGGLVVLPMNGLVVQNFTINTVISDPSTWSLSLDDNAQEFFAHWQQDGLDVQTFPSDWELSDTRWNAATHQWTPLEPGAYSLHAVRQADGTWRIVELNGPYS
jgi:hypothetical protein